MVLSKRRRVGTEIRKWVALPRSDSLEVKETLGRALNSPLRNSRRSSEMSKPMISYLEEKESTRPVPTKPTPITATRGVASVGAMIGLAGEVLAAWLCLVLVLVWWGRT